MQDFVTVRPANRLALDYAEEARKFSSWHHGIIDVHVHLNGAAAAKVFLKVMDLYGIERVYSMTRQADIEIMRGIFGDRIRFIAMPDYRAHDLKRSVGPDFIKLIKRLAREGARIVKFWCAPRRIDLAREHGFGDILRLDAPHNIEAMQVAHDLGMAFMVHVGDPDTWFAGRYSDAAVYGSKDSQYEPLEMLLERFSNPWIAAHMGGSPEDLVFLSEMLSRHNHLYLDTSAAKWMIRELGRHPRGELYNFFKRWEGRLLFGSDIVTTDAHLSPTMEGAQGAASAKASGEREAFELYASRFWALRTLFESEYEGESPIADPDLAMLDPGRYTELDAPPMRGMALPRELLGSLYHNAAHELLER